MDHKLLLRASALLLPLILSGTFIITSVTWPAKYASAVFSAETSSTGDIIDEPSRTLILKASNGLLCVYSDGELILQTEIPVASLPVQDRIALADGISVSNEEDLHHRLEDFGA